MKKKNRQWISLALSAAMIMTAVPLSGTGISAQAAASEGTEAKVSITDGTVTIGNSYLERKFSTADNSLSTTELDNKRAGLTFTPKAGSEEFIIKLRKNGESEPEGELDRRKWTVTASDQQGTSGSEGPAAKVIDGDSSTIWHSQYNPQIKEYPHDLTFDMQTEQTVAAFSYQPRQDGGVNGDIKGYRLYIGNDENNLETLENLAASGEFTGYDGEVRSTQYINLEQPKTGRYAKLIAVSPRISGQNFATAAEIKMYDKKIDTASISDEIRSSDLKLEKKKVKEINTADGVMVEFPFETVSRDGTDWDVTMKVTMDDGDHFMRKFLEIEVSDKEKAAIDYIDLESLNVDDNDTVWTHPIMGEGVGGMSGYVISLGQPVYIQGMFLGCEFPMTETEIDNNKNAHMRYFSGKTFEKLQEDNQLTTDGKYVTWQTVAGAARSTDMNVIQSDFYEYINSIATRSDFRTQYNSWYDNMMAINDANIESAFTKMEKGLSESGVEPMDSYVVDDGWNNYNKTKYGANDTEKSGTTQNVTGFWEFNSKFPNGFRPASDLAKSFGSGFGVWLGPRGGYNFNAKMGHIIEDAKYGAYNAVTQDIDVGDRRYVTKLTEFFLQMQDAYKVNYWKLDGFATKPCTNANHKHMTGGKNGIYYFTDTWEAWIDLFEALRANAAKNGIDDLWFNLTCYVNPSPWYLQWANSIWIQNSQDIGRVQVGQNRQVDQLLSYRDGRYFDFVKERQFQFPLSNIYNHDPIYGKTGTNLEKQMTDDEFRTYLYMMGTRGTAFWELYYSPEMIDEGSKWEINADYLEWAKKNYHILRNAKLIGATPDKGNTYGYSCWDGEEGIISMRNPSASVKTLSFTLDRNIGVAESLTGKTLSRTTILDHNTTDAQIDYQTVKYGDVITVTLQPGEARIWSISAAADQQAPQVTLAKAISGNQIEISFDERVKGTPTAAINGTEAVAEIGASQRKVILTSTTALPVSENITVTVNDLTDLSGNPAQINTSVNYCTDQIFAKAFDSTDLDNPGAATQTTDEALQGKTVLKLNQSCTLSGQPITGKGDFAVASYVKTTDRSTDILKQENAYSLTINAEGKAVFTVGSESVTSEQTVNDGTWKHIAGVRERNGVLKIYVNGELDSSKYVKNIEDLQSGARSIGGGTDFCISEAEIKNTTLSLTTLEQVKKVVGSNNADPILPDANGKIPLKASNIVVRSAADNSDVSNKTSTPANMIDGDHGTNKFTCTTPEFENKVNTTSAYFQIDLGDTFKLDKVKMWRYYGDSRVYQDTVVVASEDENFKNNNTVLYSSVSEENKEYAYGLVTDEKLKKPDDTYPETSDGKEFSANQEKARYIRIYMRGSIKGTNPRHGGNHICELEVYGQSLRTETAEKKNTVTFDTKGGEKVTSVKVSDGQSWQMPADPTRDGYVFAGWYTDVNTTQAYTGAGAPISSNLTLFAKWEAAEDHIAVIDQPTKRVYRTGETFDAQGLKVGLYNTDTTKRVLNDNEYTVSATDAFTAEGKQEVTLTYQANKTCTVTVPVKVVDKTAEETLTAAIKEAQQAKLDAASETVRYSSETYAAMETALANAEEIQRTADDFKEDTTAATMNEAAKELCAAVDNLELLAKITISTTDETVTLQAENAAYNTEEYCGSDASAKWIWVPITEKVTVSAPASMTGKKFAGWVWNNGTAGNVISRSSQYTFYVAGNMNITPSYDLVTETPKEEIKMVCTTLYKNAKRSFIVKRSLPKEYTLIEHGVVITDQKGWDNYYKPGAVDKKTFEKGSYRTKYSGIKNRPNNGTFESRLSCKKSDKWYARAYLKYKDQNQEEHIVYSDVLQY